ncbi:Poly(U)-binding-splicing factor puf60 [Actinomortierella ambigua]|uniref:Poly(U)-binding-splicing factor puf60 n=1 Tax=Actinomortierella ambigua TaxID=1343610 RepID=A0A9P6U057_9FUNG|nr:Poly(U)-binding-splicing factor puf60 [Actinomortierella ambigua]
MDSMESVSLKRAFAHEARGSEESDERVSASSDASSGNESASPPSTDDPSKKQRLNNVDSMATSDQNTPEIDPDALADELAAIGKGELALSDRQQTALQRAKNFARGLQDELVRTGAISSAVLPEATLTVANIIEQQKALHNLCRVYVGSISFESTESDVRARLARYGSIKELALKADPISGKHRGFCFVEYDLPEAAILSVEASETIEIGGRTIRIGRPKNYDPNSIKDLPPPPENRIYVANVGALVSESDLAGIFQAFGEVEKCVLMPDLQTRKHAGYGYVQFKEGNDIDTIVASMKGFMLLDLPMGVCKAIIGGPLPDGMQALDNIPPGTTVLPSNLMITRPAGIAAAIGAAAPLSPALIARANATAASTAQRLVAGFQRQQQQHQDQHQHGDGGHIESVAAEENLSISGSQQRYQLIQNLARSRGVDTQMSNSNRVSPSNSAGSPNASTNSNNNTSNSSGANLSSSGNSSGNSNANQAGGGFPSSSHVLSSQSVEAHEASANSLDNKMHQISGGRLGGNHAVAGSSVVRLQYKATSADVDDQLEEEFREECSKYGPVIQVHVLPLSGQFLKIFIQFGSVADARSAAAQLNGRQFDGKTIQATMYDMNDYFSNRLV